MKKIFLYAIMVALSLSGCDEKIDTKPNSQLSATNAVNFDAAGGSKTFVITSNASGIHGNNTTLSHTHENLSNTWWTSASISGPKFPTAS